MNFEQLGADLLQQPLLSNQTIPELADDEPIYKSFINDIKTDKVQPTFALKQQQQQTVSNKITPRNVPDAKPAGVVQIKNLTDNLPKPKVQIVKKIPSNVVQITDANGVKLNQAVISENMISNTPIVINKMNGNISGIFVFFNTKLIKILLDL